LIQVNVCFCTTKEFGYQYHNPVSR
jgi:hypothetical protein